MSVELADGVTWINECHDVAGGRHEHVSVYLVEEAGSYILVDSGAFSHRGRIRETVEAATGGAGLDALVLSHSDLPHSANVRPFRAEWDDVDLLVSTGSPTQGLPDAAVTVDVGGERSILGREFAFIDPPLADRNHTMWIYDGESGGLFTIDGFGAYHAPGECDRTSGDLEGGIAYGDVYDYHRDTLTWLRYVDPPKLRRALDRIFEAHAVEYLAPVHGPPVAGDDLDRYLDTFTRAVGAISDDFRVPAVLE